MRYRVIRDARNKIDIVVDLLSKSGWSVQVLIIIARGIESDVISMNRNDDESDSANWTDVSKRTSGFAYLFHSNLFRKTRDHTEKREMI